MTGTIELAPPTGDVELSVPRLYLLRAGYLFLGGGLAIYKLPVMFYPHLSWTFYQGIANSMLSALCLLALLLGLRHPVRMLPILLFESAWKVVWLAGVALPLWSADRMDAVTRDTVVECLPIVFILAVIPWRHVVRHYVTGPSDPWRRGATS